MLIHVRDMILWRRQVKIIIEILNFDEIWEFFFHHPTAINILPQWKCGYNLKII